MDKWATDCPKARDFNVFSFFQLQLIRMLSFKSFEKRNEVYFENSHLLIS